MHIFSGQFGQLSTTVAVFTFSLSRVKGKISNESEINIKQYILPDSVGSWLWKGDEAICAVRELYPAQYLSNII